LGRLCAAVFCHHDQLLVDDLLFMVHDNGVASCLDAKTGQVVWSERLGGNYSASPVLAGGTIYFCSHDDRTTVIRPGREYQKIAVNELDDQILASPASTGKAINLRTRTHLYRIEERP
jgi:outer membrane protein assembly factor BamB